MAKLLPLLTAAAMIGVIGGMLLWLIVSHRGNPELAAGSPPTPDLGVRVDAGESRSVSSSSASDTATKVSVRSSETRSIHSAETAPSGEALISHPDVGTQPGPPCSDGTLSPE